MKIGIIGGSGLDKPNILEDFHEIEVNTPYGQPSSKFQAGRIAGKEVIILSRHGRAHNLTPTGVNYKANISAMKQLEVSHIIATTAVGSLKEEIGRGDIVILDQFIDFTKHRAVTFFDNFDDGARHTQMSEPFDNYMREHLIESAKNLDMKFHSDGTVITIEGPRFSTKAESKMFRMWGADVINMSIAPECILANELGIPYAAIAMSTDYDCWKEDEQPVTFEEILKVFESNVEKVTKLLVDVIAKI